MEAGAGYGKSVLARQYQQELGVATAFVPAGPPDDDPAVLMGSVRRALLASRLSDLTSATDVTDPAAGVERLLDALAALPVPLLVVLDDAHHLRGAEAAGLVLRLARGLPAPHRLLVGRAPAGTRARTAAHAAAAAAWTPGRWSSPGRRRRR